MSDQDFFFEEEPEGTKPADKSSKAAKQPVTDAPATSVTSSGDDQSTTWAIAMLIGIIGLLLGAILGFLLGTSLAKSAAPAATTPAATAPAANVPATNGGQLTTEQIQGGLPAGHPQVSIPTSESAETTK